VTVSADIVYLSNCNNSVHVYVYLEDHQISTVTIDQRDQYKHNFVRPKFYNNTSITKKNYSTSFSFIKQLKTTSEHI
jgi:hypothetical protein